MTDVRRPWALDPGRTPVERILGKEFAVGGPLGLLGIPPADCTPEAVASALSRQLERVSDHPHAGSHEADEVRLALHSAAAQLMDSRTRDAIIIAAIVGSGWKRPRRPLSPLVIARARGEIRRTLGRFGGLNNRSIRFLSLVAERHGIGRDQIAEAVRASVREPGRAARGPAPASLARSAAPVRSAPANRAPGAPSVAELDPAVRFIRLALILSLVAVVTIGVAVTAVWVIVRAVNNSEGTNQTGADAPAPVVDRRSAKPSGESAPTRDGPEVSPAARSADPAATSRSLSDSVEMLARAPDAALEQFASAFRALSTSWVDLEPDRAASTQDAVVEFLFRAAGNPSVAEDAARVVLEGSAQLREPPSPIDADRVLPGVWSIGTLARLARERELPARVRSMIDSELAAAASGVISAGTGSFAAGASAALYAMPRTLVRARTGQSEADVASMEAFGRWLAAVRAVTASDKDPAGKLAASRLLLSALETVLLDGPEPEAGSPAAAVVSMLVTADDWRADSDARSHLMRWFDSSSVSSVDLHAVTEALATSSRADGVDATMVLGAHAQLPQRQELRDRYLSAWALADRGAVDALVEEWAKAVNGLTVSDQAVRTPVEMLARAAILSRANLAATMLHAGLSAEPGDVLRALDAPVLSALGSQGAGAAPANLSEGASDGSWAIKYLAAEKNIPLRGALLNDLGQQNMVLGPVDAEVLAGEAFRGSPAQVRRSAADLLLKFSSSPAVLNAALEQAPFIAPSTENAELVSKISLGRLPGVRDPQWRLAVRRALVERLLQTLAGQSDDRAVDAISEVIADAYSGRVSVAAVDRRSGSSGQALSADRAAAEVRAAWQRWAEAIVPTGREALTLEQIKRRHAGRTGLSEGLVQSFAAEQMTTVELMAYVIAAERAEAARDVREILEALAETRRGADHIFAQILAAERAIADLWLIRLNAGGPA